MDLSVEQQIFDLLDKATHVLIALPENLNADCLASGLALQSFLQKMQKQVMVASSGKVPDRLLFLPKAQHVSTSLPHGKGLTVVLDTSKNKLDELSYKTEDHKVSIFLKPKEGIFEDQDVTILHDKALVDLIIILDSRNLEDLGKLFEQQADLFFETPKINIDNAASNEYFGAVNLVDVTATSIAEILFTLFEKNNSELIDEDIATCLLAGIIVRTNSFQYIQTTPRAFLVASQLKIMGGRQQEIIQRIYKTKSLPYLKLWGRTLARLKEDKELSLVYSVLNVSDFQKTGSEGGNDLMELVTELVDSISAYQFLGILAEVQPKFVTLLLAIPRQVTPEQVLSQLGVNGEWSAIPGKQHVVITANFDNTSLLTVEESLTSAARSISSQS